MTAELHIPDGAPHALSPHARAVADHYDNGDYYLSGWHPRHLHFGIFKPDEEPFRQDGPAAGQLDRDLLERAVVRMIEEVAGPAHVGAGDVVVDAACGVGGTALYLARTLGCRVIGLNISERQMEIARELAASDGMARLVEFRFSDCSEEIRLPDSSVDVVVCIESACHMADRDRFLKECARILGPGGRMVVQDWMAAPSLTPEDYRNYIQPICDAWSMSGLEDAAGYFGLLEAAGLELAEFEDMSARCLPNQYPEGSGEPDEAGRSERDATPGQAGMDATVPAADPGLVRRGVPGPALLRAQARHGRQGCRTIIVIEQTPRGDHRVKFWKQGARRALALLLAGAALASCAAHGLGKGPDPRVYVNYTPYNEAFYRELMTGRVHVYAARAGKLRNVVAGRGFGSDGTLFECFPAYRDNKRFWIWKETARWSLVKQRSGVRTERHRADGHKGYTSEFYDPETGGFTFESLKQGRWVRTHPGVIQDTWPRALANANACPILKRRAQFRINEKQTSLRMDELRRQDPDAPIRHFPGSHLTAPGRTGLGASRGMPTTTPEEVRRFLIAQVGNVVTSASGDGYVFSGAGGSNEVWRLADDGGIAQVGQVREEGGLADCRGAGAAGFPLSGGLSGPGSSHRPSSCRVSAYGPSDRQREAAFFAAYGGGLCGQAFHVPYRGEVLGGGSERRPGRGPAFRRRMALDEGQSRDDDQGRSGGFAEHRLARTGLRSRYAADGMDAVHAGQDRLRRSGRCRASSAAFPSRSRFPASRACPVRA